MISQILREHYSKQCLSKKPSSQFVCSAVLEQAIMLYIIHLNVVYCILVTKLKMHHCNNIKLC